MIRTSPASRWVWWLANMAEEKPYSPVPPAIGDIVVETTHVIGLSRVRLGLHSAVGELIEIDDSDKNRGKRYLIRSADPLVGDCWWENCHLKVIEKKRETQNE